MGQGTWAAAALIAGMVAGQPALANDADTVVARVGDTEITLGHVVGLMARLPEQYRQLPDEMLFSGIVEQLVDQTAVAQSVAEPFNTRLRVDLDNSRREVIVNDELARVVEGAATDEALQALYAELYLDVEPEREFNAAHILVPTEEEAQALAAALADGADFAHLARENSGDPGSAEAGGALGWFGPGQMVGPFDAAVQALEPGQVSEPVQTQFGWHLILLEDTRMADAPTLEQVRGQLSAELQREAVAAHVAAARAATTVELLSEGIDPALVRDQSLLED
ncbi:peptidylprolyl isomerase [Rhodobaculum claviforme]|uniref:Parvulin-like PPIase n=1 Tax=Rhodobaculum claviforme TaxID=1549854 RepID=A0A934TKC1_9RHOB|nr:peptidylprolyl isomerase [Rhodobaculum claviforme]MBK5927026.1 hypothetical protein [Rhodobaculum claviforme]